MSGISKAVWTVKEQGGGDGSYVTDISWERDEGCFWISGINLSVYQIDGLITALNEIKKLEPNPC